MSFYKNLKAKISKHTVLLKNFTSLSILQISQYIFPLITFPYLVRVLGPDGYGLVAFANAFVGYFTVITEYGFTLSATKEVSINRNNHEELNRVFNSVLSVKMILFLVCIFLFFPIVFGFSKFNSDLEIYLMSFVSVLGTTLFPVWFFQGTERMTFIAIINIMIKVIWVISVFLLIHSAKDILLLIILNSISSLLVGLVGIIVVKKYFKISFRFSPIDEIVYQLKTSFIFFVSNVSISFYTFSNVFILGLFASNSVVGYFSAADKIRQAVQNIISISGRTVFPHLANEFERSKTSAIIFLKKYLLSFGTFSLITCLLIFIFAESIILIVLGEGYTKSISILKIISFLPFIIFVSDVFGIQIMINLNLVRDYLFIYLKAGLFSIILTFLLVPLFYDIGLAFVILFTEIFVTITMYRFITLNGILRNDGR